MIHLKPVNLAAPLALIDITLGLLPVAYKWIVQVVQSTRIKGTSSVRIKVLSVRIKETPGSQKILFF